jgi:hypothetical protein
MTKEYSVIFYSKLNIYTLLMQFCASVCKCSQIKISTHRNDRYKLSVNSSSHILQLGEHLSYK